MRSLRSMRSMHATQLATHSVARRLLPTAAGVLAACLLAACGDVARLVTPDGNPAAKGAATSAAVDAQLVLSALSSQDDASLRIVARYLRTDQSRMALGERLRSLSSASLQAVPLSFDLAPCLADASRDVPVAGQRSCLVVLELFLLVGETVVDQQELGPMRLAPGVSRRIADPVTLSVISDIELSVGTNPVLTEGQRVETVVGSALSVRGVIRDIKGNAVGNRNIVWRSESPATATIDGSGVVSTLAPGSARIRGTVGGVTRSFLLAVLPPPALLTVVASPGSGTGTVRSTPTGIDCRVQNGATTGVCAASFPIGAAVTLASIADQGSAFSQWGEGCAGSTAANTCIVNVTGAGLASARFLALRRVQINGGGDGTGRVTGPAGIDCQLVAGVATGSCAVDVIEGTLVTLTAINAAAGAGTFAAWGGVCSASNGNACTFTVGSANPVASANFFAAKPLTVQPAGNGDGTITATGIACAKTGAEVSGPCTAAYDHGTSVTLTAVATSTSTFTAWTGACASSTGVSCTTSMTAARTVGATFTRKKVAVMLQLTGGAGAVAVNGVTACNTTVNATETDCIVSVDMGVPVSIAATPAAEHRFLGFDGACSGVATCVITPLAAVSVGARFVPNALTITIGNTLGGTAGGTLKGSGEAERLDCTLSGGLASGVCQVVVPYASTVTLRAVQLPNGVLTRWGAPCEAAESTTCTFAVTKPVEVSAKFDQAIDVTVNLFGNAPGTVEFDVPGVPRQSACTTTGAVAVTCRFGMPLGMPGVFRATPGAGAIFSGFTGACSDAGSPPFATCLFRGVGLLRDVYATFVR